MAFGRTWLLEESTFSTILISLIGSITVTRSRTWIKCAQLKQFQLFWGSMLLAGQRFFLLLTKNPKKEVSYLPCWQNKHSWVTHTFVPRHAVYCMVSIMYTLHLRLISLLQEG